MKGSALQRLDQGVRHLLPVGVTLALILVNAIPFRLPAFAAVEPVLPLIAVFYWSIYRPELLPAPVAFGLGVIEDMIAGGPLGVSALVYLLVQGATVSQRRFFHGKSFFVLWLGFALYGICAFFLQWTLVSLLFGRSSGFRAVAFEFIMTLSFYPLLSWLFARLQMTWLRDA